MLNALPAPQPSRTPCDSCPPRGHLPPRTLFSPQTNVSANGNNGSSSGQQNEECHHLGTSSSSRVSRFQRSSSRYHPFPRQNRRIGNSSGPRTVLPPHASPSTDPTNQNWSNPSSPQEESQEGNGRALVVTPNRDPIDHHSHHSHSSPLWGGAHMCPSHSPSSHPSTSCPVYFPPSSYRGHYYGYPSHPHPPHPYMPQGPVPPGVAPPPWSMRPLALHGQPFPSGPRRRVLPPSSNRRRVRDVAMANNNSGNTTSARGTRSFPFTATQDDEDKIQSITAMRTYRDKSFEELRFEDYVMGNKGMAKTDPNEKEEDTPKNIDEEEKKKNEYRCAVCLDAKRSVLFLPCCHMCTCADCSKEKSLKRCPICREKIEEKKDVFW